MCASLKMHLNVHRCSASTIARASLGKGGGAGIRTPSSSRPGCRGLVAARSISDAGLPIVELDAATLTIPLEGGVLSLTPPPELDNSSGTGGDGDGGLPPDNSGDDKWNGGEGDDNSDKNTPVEVWTLHPLTILSRGVRGRLTADPFFAHKLAVECGLDAAIIVGVNYGARRERFWPEIEFTLCQLAISLLSDFALVYLLAPSNLRSAAKAGSFRAALESLPSHVFQRANLGKPFSPAARLATFLIKSLQYGGVGVAMGCLGAATVQGLVLLREKIDPNFKPPATVQSVSGTGAAWGGFMATSSNLRYNLVNGFEDALYRRSSGAGKLGSVALRLLNSWTGAVQWVWFTNYLDLDRPWMDRPGNKPRDSKGRARKGERKGRWQ